MVLVSVDTVSVRQLSGKVVSVRTEHGIPAVPYELKNNKIQITDIFLI